MRHHLPSFVLCLFALAFGAVAAPSKREEIKQRKADTEAFFEENGKRKGVITTKSGLQYEILERSNSALSPRGKDIVTVHYHGTLLDGRVFESTMESGQPLTMQLWDAIDGWEEGIKLMAIGDTFRFYIPSALAYGSSPKATIPAHSALIFEIQLLSIKRK